MAEIKVLPGIIADKIAAGEVAERPSAVVKELVENSIDAGATKISVEIRNGGIKYISVEDNGKGISAKDLPSIFERFYRTDSSRNSSKGGSGIGLSIVKKIVEDHGGYIWATSKEGEGTCMHFVLRKYLEAKM